MSSSSARFQTETLPATGLPSGWYPGGETVYACGHIYWNASFRGASGKSMGRSAQDVVEMGCCSPLPDFYGCFIAMFAGSTGACAPSSAALRESRACLKVCATALPGVNPAGRCVGQAVRA